MYLFISRCMVQAIRKFTAGGNLGQEAVAGVCWAVFGFGIFTVFPLFVLAEAESLVKKIFLQAASESLISMLNQIETRSTIGVDRVFTIKLGK